MPTVLLVSKPEQHAVLQCSEQEPETRWLFESSPQRAMKYVCGDPPVDLIVLDGETLGAVPVCTFVRKMRSCHNAPILFIQQDVDKTAAPPKFDLPNIHVHKRSHGDLVLRHAIRRFVRTSVKRARDQQERIPVPSTREQLRLISELFGEVGADPGENIHTIVNQSIHVIGGAASLYNRLDEERKSLVMWAEHRVPAGAPDRDQPDGHICFEATIKGGNKPVVIGDIWKTEYAQTDPNVARFGLRSYIGFPITVDGETVGSLCVVDTVPRDFSDSDVDAMGSLARAVEQEERRVGIQKRMNDLLKEASSQLGQKELLGREIRHRIKNDLAIVKATLDMTAAREGDDRVRTPLIEAANQIDVMVRVYERLTERSESDIVELDGLIRDLIRDLSSTIIPEPVRVVLDLRPCTAPAKVSFAAGTIVNELVTNAVKYAFADTVSPQISIVLREEGAGTVRLTVADNGAGLPEDIVHGQTCGFGLQATQALAKQYGGWVEMTGEPGTTVSVLLRFSS